MSLRFLGAVLAPLLLCACVTSGAGSGGPGTVLDQTTLDERAAIAAENAYQAAATAAIAAHDAGAIDEAGWVRVQRADRHAYALLSAVRAAYSAGNAASYREALSNAWGAIGELTRLTADPGSTS
jgi:hypothetical protein